MPPVTQPRPLALTQIEKQESRPLRRSGTGLAIEAALVCFLPEAQPKCVCSQSLWSLLTLFKWGHWHQPKHKELCSLLWKNSLLRFHAQSQIYNQSKYVVSIFDIRQELLIGKHLKYTYLPDKDTCPIRSSHLLTCIILLIHPWYSM